MLEEFMRLNWDSRRIGQKKDIIVEWSTFQYNWRPRNGSKADSWGQQAERRESLKDTLPADNARRKVVDNLMARPVALGTQLGGSVINGRGTYCKMRDEGRGTGGNGVTVVVAGSKGRGRMDFRNVVRYRPGCGASSNGWNWNIALKPWPGHSELATNST